MKMLARKFLNVLANEGLGYALRRVMAKIGWTDPLLRRRIFLSDKLNEEFGGVVRYGMFEGFKFSNRSWWGGPDRSSMLLGLYEKEVQDSLSSVDQKYRTFIDIGAADGFYAVGVLIAGRFDRSYCYEMSDRGRRTIKDNAVLNCVEDKIIIMGKADHSFVHDIPQDDLIHSVLFVDIEGGEFALLTDRVLNAFRNSIVFVEIHDFLIEGGQAELLALRSRVTKYFSITELTTGVRDLSQFDELRRMGDTDRWLLCSEGRGQRMTWWRLDPIVQ